MGSETLSSVCYKLSNKSSIPFNSTSNGYSYRSPHSQKEEIQKQFQKLISDKIVDPSVSPYNSPLLLVTKKSLPNSEKKKWRLVIDYHQINKKLLSDKLTLLD